MRRGRRYTCTYICFTSEDFKKGRKELELKVVFCCLVDGIKPPQRCLHPNHWSSEYAVTWKTEIKVVDGNKIVKQFTLGWGDYHGLSREPSVIPKTLISERERLREEGVRGGVGYQTCDNMRSTQPNFAGLNMEEWGH